MGVVTSLIAGAATSLVGGAISAGAAGKAAKNARNERQAAEAKLEALKNSRQEVINPYENVQDLTSLMKNPFEQLGVATQAAEIQMEQSDIALANTLDAIRSTGAGAGGATALAQAALESKKNIAANIEQQEAQNEKLKAQGEQQLIQQKIAEQQRLQSVEAAGKEFQFQVKENSLNADMDRVAGMADRAAAQEASANQAKAQAWGGAIGALGGLGSSAIGAYGDMEVARINKGQKIWVIEIHR